MNKHNNSLRLYLSPAYFIDSDHPIIVQKAHEVVKDINGPIDQAIALNDFVRDSIRYNPYNINLDHHEMKASTVLTRPSGEAYCIEKACLLAAMARAVAIPARLGFSNVRNHIGTEKLEMHLKTDVMVFHGYTELYLNGKWVKATPAFNKGLCDYLGVDVLEFDGKNDSIFQEYDKEGSRYMEYLKDFGTFHDVPHDLFVKELKEHYPHFFGKVDLNGDNIIEQMENLEK
ncbi:MAG: transglutaminase family protein [Bacteroidota bacterium]